MTDRVGLFALLTDPVQGLFQTFLTQYGDWRGSSHAVAHDSGTRHHHFGWFLCRRLRQCRDNGSACQGSTQQHPDGLRN